MLPKVRVTFHSPLPKAIRTDQIDVNPLYSQIEITTQLPGGWNTCVLTAMKDEYGKYYNTFPKIDIFRALGHVTCTIGGQLIFEGAITKLKETGGIITEITCTGYAIVGLNLDWYKNNQVNVSSDVAQIQATQQSAGSIIADAVSSAAPLIRLGNKNEFKDPGTIFIPGTFYGQTPAQIIESVTKVGNSLNVLWDMWVYEDRVLNLRPRQLSGDAKYSIPADDTTERIRDFNKITGQERVEYSLPEWDLIDKQNLVVDHNGNYQTLDQINPNFVKKYGIMKRSYVKAGQLTASIANQFRDTDLLVHEEPDITCTVHRDGSRGIETALGGEIFPYMVRSGEWMEIAGSDALIVVRTKWNNQGSFECELSKTAQSWEAFISYLAEISRHVVQSTNPLTGLRA